MGVSPRDNTYNIYYVINNIKCIYIYIYIYLFYTSYTNYYLNNDSVSQLINYAVLTIRVFIKYERVEIF